MAEVTPRYPEANEQAEMAGIDIIRQGWDPDGEWSHVRRIHVWRALVGHWGKRYTVLETLWFAYTDTLRNSRRYGNRGTGKEITKMREALDRKDALAAIVYLKKYWRKIK